MPSFCTNLQGRILLQRHPCEKWCLNSKLISLCVCEKKRERNLLGTSRVPCEKRLLKMEYSAGGTRPSRKTHANKANYTWWWKPGLIILVHLRVPALNCSSLICWLLFLFMVSLIDSRLVPTCPGNHEHEFRHDGQQSWKASCWQLIAKNLLNGCVQIVAVLECLDTSWEEDRNKCKWKQESTQHNTTHSISFGNFSGQRAGLISACVKRTAKGFKPENVLSPFALGLIDLTPTPAEPPLRSHVKRICMRLGRK